MKHSTFFDSSFLTCTKSIIDSIGYLFWFCSILLMDEFINIDEVQEIVRSEYNENGVEICYCKVIGSNFNNLKQIPIDVLFGSNVLDSYRKRGETNMENNIHPKYLLGKRINQYTGEAEFFVKYQEFPGVYGTWEPASFFSEDLIRKYEERKIKQEHPFMSSYDREILNLLINRMNFSKPTILNTTTDLFYISTLFAHCYKEYNAHNFLITTNKFENCLSYFYLNTSANIILINGQTTDENMYIINSLKDDSYEAFNIYIVSNSCFVNMKNVFLEIEYDVVCFLLEGSDDSFIQCIQQIKCKYFFTYLMEKNTIPDLDAFLRIYFPNFLTVYKSMMLPEEFFVLMFNTIALNNFKAGSQNKSKEILIDCPLTPIQYQEIFSIYSTQATEQQNYIIKANYVDCILVHPFLYNNPQKQTPEIHQSMKLIALMKLLDYFNNNEIVIVYFTNPQISDAIFTTFFEQKGRKKTDNPPKWNFLNVKKPLTNDYASRIFKKGNVVFLTYQSIQNQIRIKATKAILVQNSSFSNMDTNILSYCIRSPIEYYRLCTSITHEIFCFAQYPNSSLVNFSLQYPQVFFPLFQQADGVPFYFQQQSIEEQIKFSFFKPVEIPSNSNVFCFSNQTTDGIQQNFFQTKINQDFDNQKGRKGKKKEKEETQIEQDVNSNGINETFEQENGNYLLHLLTHANDDEATFISDDFLAENNQSDENQKKSSNYQPITQQNFYRIFEDDIQEEGNEQNQSSENQNQESGSKIDLFQSAMKFILLHPITSKDKVKNIPNCYETALVFVKWTIDYTQQASDVLISAYSQITENIEDSLATMESLIKKKYYLDVILFARFNIFRINELAAVACIVQNNIQIPQLPPFTSSWTHNDDALLVTEVWRCGYGHFPDIYTKSEYEISQRLSFIIEETIPDSNQNIIRDEDFSKVKNIEYIIKKLRCFGCFTTQKSFNDNMCPKSNFKTTNHFLTNIIVNFQLLNNDPIFHFPNITKQRVLDAVACKQIIADFLAMKVSNPYLPAMIVFLFTQSSHKLHPLYQQIFQDMPQNDVVKNLFPIVKEINKTMFDERRMVLDLDANDFVLDPTNIKMPPFIKPLSKNVKMSQKQTNASNSSEKRISQTIYEFSKRKTKTNQFVDDFKEIPMDPLTEYILPETRILTADSLLKRYHFDDSDFDENHTILLKSEFPELQPAPEQNENQNENTVDPIVNDNAGDSVETESVETNTVETTDEEEEEKAEVNTTEPIHIQTRNRKQNVQAHPQEISGDTVVFPWAVSENLVIKSLGTPCNEDKYFSTRNLWNPGFKSKILLNDIKDINRFVWYKSEIIKGENGPIFRVTCKDNNEVSEGSSPSIAWKYFMRQMRAPLTQSGLDLYGISIPIVHKAMWNTEGGRIIKEGLRFQNRRRSLLDHTAQSDSSNSIKTKLPPLDVTTFDLNEEIGLPSWDKMSPQNLIDNNSSIIHFNFSMEAFTKQPVISGYNLKDITPEEFIEKLNEQ